ncbi:AAA family ATPase [Chitinophaga pinensis]|uniref:AAA family ATPase n=1 Tax=Chitinophaga pinensis TaxID=79329 RepID=A0A5C6LSR4_9BACT|nr:AAA family ATPase [Chitinophaga pinensis]TWV99686.1 AAA family ATPase [Chitinophaga pinensis]
MSNIFITSINIGEVLNVKQLRISLSTDERKHLIITGRNGSGKTSLLLALKAFIKTHLVNASLVVGVPVVNMEENSDRFPVKGLELKLNSRQAEIINEIRAGKFIVAFFDSKRESSFNKPTGISKVEFKPRYSLDDKIAREFIQYIVNLKADRSFAKDENEDAVVAEVDSWFSRFEKSLAELFGNPEIKLSFDRKNYNFNLLEPGKSPYNLNELSDGYSAILSIITELILRMDSIDAKSYDVEGIVLIDEVETHLHIELQKKILPFLTSFFPKIQFIVTTHSPFVLSSIENAVICDLEKKIVTDDLSGYSYDTLIESYFEADKYSTVLKNKIQEYERLMAKESLQDSEKLKLEELKRYIEDVPKFLADELAVKIQQIQLKKLNNKKNQ